MYKVSVNRKLLLERAQLQEDMNDLVKALKADDYAASKKALVNLDPKKWQISASDFRKLTDFVSRDELEKARSLLGVTKGTPDPSLGKPASLTPAQLHGKTASSPSSATTPATSQQSPNRGTGAGVQLTPDELNYLDATAAALDMPDFSWDMGEEAFKTFHYVLRQYKSSPRLSKYHDLYKSIMNKIEKHYKNKYGETLVS